MMMPTANLGTTTWAKKIFFQFSPTYSLRLLNTTALLSKPTEETILHPDCSRPFWIQTLLCQLWSLPGPCLGSVWPQVHGLAAKTATKQTQQTLTNSNAKILLTNSRAFQHVKLSVKGKVSGAHWASVADLHFVRIPSDSQRLVCSGGHGVILNHYHLHAGSFLEGHSHTGRQRHSETLRVKRTAHSEKVEFMSRFDKQLWFYFLFPQEMLCFSISKYAVNKFKRGRVSSDFKSLV